MSASDTTAVNPRDDGAIKADRMDQDTAKPSNPKTGPDVSPGPDTRDEPDSTQ